ncbi:hypothetical protein [Candidatus Magnetobacterium casense]|uniref:Uncharacterized protein n=1 Tax=Candidatus Magnetobacterium casense TaxID=1455061 RepID=A0ABS6S191_9BACT|nr:hypothetical protein [Candidatus Magnetobacterium casensis]MBV6342615.1 hypothetical protein [Candidatus Magnetobacterium casensis]
MVTTVMAAKLPRNTEPVCMMLLGPSGWGKTEMMRPILNWRGVGIDLDTITPKALASGAPGGPDRSLLCKSDRRCLVIKDFTTILSRPEIHESFFGTIRSAYDNSFTKYSGATSTSLDIRARFTLLAGMIPKVYTYLERDQDRGYRYLLVWCRRSHSDDYLTLVQDMINDKFSTLTSWRDSIKTRVRSAFRTLFATYNIGPEDPPQQDPHEPDAMFHTRVTNYQEEYDAHVHRIVWPSVTLTPDYRSWVKSATRILSYVRLGSGDPIQTEADMPSYSGKSERPAPFRAQKQLNTLVQMRAVADNRTSTSASDIAFCRAICRDTLPPGRILILDRIYQAQKAGSPLSLVTLPVKIQRSATYVQTVVAHLSRTGLLDIHEDTGTVEFSAGVLEDLERSTLLEKKNDLSAFEA